MAKSKRAKSVRAWAMVGIADGHIYYGTLSFRRADLKDRGITVSPCRIARVIVREVLKPKRRGKARGEEQ